MGAGWDWCQSQLGKTSVGVGRPQPQVSVALGQDRRRPGRAQPLSSRAAGGQCGCVGIRRGAAVLGWGGPPKGPDSRIRGRKGWGSRPPSLREEGWGPGPPGPKEEGLRPCAPGSEGERAGGPDSRVRGARRELRHPPPQPQLLGAWEQQVRQKPELPPPFRARGLFPSSPATKKAPPSLQTGTRGSQIPLDAHTPSPSV